MLNISKVSVSSLLKKNEFKTFSRLETRRHSKIFLRMLMLMSAFFIACMFLPWTQNIRSTGKVTTLNPYDKPQKVQPIIGGQIDQWYVTEGDVVQVGDTIVTLTEAKEAYFDPQLLANTKEQQDAKIKSAEAYKSKTKFLKDQLDAIEKLQQSKLEQLEIKSQQIDIEMASVEQEVFASKTYVENAKNQLDRMEIMYDKGIKSLTALEKKRLSNREAQAKLIASQNKLNKLANEKDRIEQEKVFTNSDYEQKYAKVESEILSANSNRYSVLGESNKLQSTFNQIEQRQNAFVITSPITGRITKVLKNGIGEFVKAQDNIATIVPIEYEKAVELYIAPNDMPLIQEGKNVRLQFDGWPAMVFSGWPNNSFGTFGGVVYAIDNEISANGRYRILVVENGTDKPWPDLIRIGSGARGLLLLNDVKVYYEVWRNLNGFPPDFYVPEKQKEIKNKAPLRKFK